MQVCTKQNNTKRRDGDLEEPSSNKRSRDRPSAVDKKKMAVEAAKLKKTKFGRGVPVCVEISRDLTNTLSLLGLN